MRTISELIEILESYDPETKVRIGMLPEGHSYQIDEVAIGQHRQFEDEDVCYLIMGTQESYDMQGEELGR